MSLQPASFACDVCKKRRSADFNNWYLLRPISGGGVDIDHWDDERAKFPDIAHACGQDHAQQLIARWMSRGDFTDGVKGTK